MTPTPFSRQDAFSKTVPIWAAVVNAAVATLKAASGAKELDPAWADTLQLPPWVPLGETERVRQHLPGWAVELLQVGMSLGWRTLADLAFGGWHAHMAFQQSHSASLLHAQVSPDLGGLADQLTKPLRCLWIGQDSHLGGREGEWQALPFTPLLLVSASLPSGRQRRVLSLAGSDGSRPERTTPVPYDYIPGAGDDEETWARGLTADVFWAHWRSILAAGPGGAEMLVDRLMAGSRGSAGVNEGHPHRPRAAMPVARDAHHRAPAGVSSVTFVSDASASTGGGPAPVPGTRIFVSLGLDGGELPGNGAVLDVRWAENASIDQASTRPYLCCPVPPSKKDKDGLRQRLRALLSFAAPHVAQGLTVVGDADGDAAACTAVAVLCRCFALDPATGAPSPRPAGGPRPTVSKLDVRRALALVSAVAPLARPTRSMLKQVFNHFYRLDSEAHGLEDEAEGTARRSSVIEASI